MREVDKHLGLIDVIDRRIPDARNSFCTVHTQRTMRAQRIFGIASGLDSLADWLYSHGFLLSRDLFSGQCEQRPLKAADQRHVVKA